MRANHPVMEAALRACKRHASGDRDAAQAAVVAVIERYRQMGESRAPGYYYRVAEYTIRWEQARQYRHNEATAPLGEYEDEYDPQRESEREALFSRFAAVRDEIFQALKIEPPLAHAIVASYASRGQVGSLCRLRHRFENALRQNLDAYRIWRRLEELK